MSRPPQPPPPRRRSLHSQFMRSLLWPLLLSFVLASSAITAVGWRDHQAQQAALRAQTLQAFVQSLSKPLWDCDSATVQGIVETLALQPGVHDVRLLDRCSGEELSAGAAPGTRAQPPLQAPVFFRDGRGRDYDVGTLELRYSDQSIARAAVQGLAPQLALFGATLLAVLVGAARAFRRTVGTPLRRFRSAILAQRAVHVDGEAPPRHLDELHDVTHAYDAMVQELQRLARHDALTGLPNRMALGEHLQRELEQARLQPGRGVCVLVIDLDGFKPINDSLGHAAGDQVLQGVAQRLRAAVRAQDFVARLGGDEFVVVAPGECAGETLAALLQRIDRAVRTPLRYAGQELTVRASVGAACHPRDGQDAESLLAHADAAMYGNKPRR